MPWWKTLGGLVGNEMQCFADAAGFLHDLRLACNACLTMLLQKIHQLIESFRSDFWPGMVHDAGISPCVTGVLFLPWLFQQLTAPQIRLRAWGRPQTPG